MIVSHFYNFYKNHKSALTVSFSILVTNQINAVSSINVEQETIKFCINKKKSDSEQVMIFTVNY